MIILAIINALGISLYNTNINFTIAISQAYQSQNFPLVVELLRNPFYSPMDDRYIRDFIYGYECVYPDGYLIEFPSLAAYTRCYTTYVTINTLVRTGMAIRNYCNIPLNGNPLSTFDLIQKMSKSFPVERQNCHQLLYGAWNQLEASDSYVVWSMAYHTLNNTGYIWKIRLENEKQAEKHNSIKKTFIGSNNTTKILYYAVFPNINLNGDIEYLLKYSEQAILKILTFNSVKWTTNLARNIFILYGNWIHWLNYTSIESVLIEASNFGNIPFHHPVVNSTLASNSTLLKQVITNLLQLPSEFESAVANKLQLALLQQSVSLILQLLDY